MSNRQSILEKLFSAERQLPTLPVIFTELNEMIRNPFVSSRRIADLVMKDQALVARILKLSNSAFYAKRQEIKDLANAVTFLGSEALRNLVLQLSLVRLFPRLDPQVPDFRISTFWEHSLAAAYFSTILAAKLKLPPDESYYVSGLLHDMGKLALCHFHPELFSRTVMRQIELGETDYRAEAEVIGVDHAEIGAFLAEKWKFRSETIKAIREHHLASFTGADLHAPLVRIANFFAKAAGFNFPWDAGSIDLVGDRAWVVLSARSKQKLDVERMTFEIYEESDKVRDLVNTLLSLS